MPFKRNDIAYFAGLYEGEGYVYTSRFYWNRRGEKVPRKTPQVKLRIGMTDVEPLERVVRTIGGRINGPYQYNDDKPAWMFDIDSPKLVREVIRKMYPYLSPRRQQQIDEALK